MRELLSQKEQRQLKILEYLFENPNWIYLDDLSKIIGYNARIIKSDIKELREVFPDFDIRHSTAGIMMVNVQNNGIERIYQYFLQTSDYFQILKAFFLLDSPSPMNIFLKLWISLFRLYAKRSRISIRHLMEPTALN